MYVLSIYIQVQLVENVTIQLQTLIMTLKN